MIGSRKTPFSHRAEKKSPTRGMFLLQKTFNVVYLIGIDSGNEKLNELMLPCLEKPRPSKSIRR
jgi:hypothetical protein